MYVETNLPARNVFSVPGRSSADEWLNRWATPSTGVPARPAPVYHPPTYPEPQGCICPPTSEKTCQGARCPRRAR